jgi:hypothetical protein
MDKKQLLGKLILTKFLFQKLEKTLIMIIRWS